MEEVVKKTIAHIVHSTGGRLGGFSLRDEDGSASGFKRALETGGFAVGDVVAIVTVADLDALIAERDSWKRRAEQHGCNVVEGDHECG